MTRTLVIAGLLLLAALLPLAAMPLAVFVLAAPLLAASTAKFVCVHSRSVALAALANPRAPPSR